jgi:predicted transcriptional regulator
MKLEARDTSEAVINVKVPAALKRAVVEIATARDVSVAVVVQQALAEYVKAHPPRRPGHRGAPPRRVP